MKNQHGRELSGTEMAEMLDEWCNGARKNDFTEFSQYLTTRTHRTIQQKVMGAFIETIEAWSLSSFDGRNEATVKLCKRIIEATGDRYDRALPHI